jgi:CDP-glycerol glycerophosphotransferase (TagB/SpsB family)
MKNKFIVAASKLIGYFGSFFPKKRNLVILGAMNGKYFGDNSKYVFKYLYSNCPDLEISWITKSNKVYKYLKKRKMPIAKAFSLKGLLLLFRATIGLFTNSLSDISPSPFMVPRNIKLIALRHGRSVKRIRFARKKHKITKEERDERKYESKLINYVISTSNFISKIQEECLKLGIKKAIVTGYPRNDIFYDKKRKKIVNNKNTCILYAPSWRHGRKATKFFPFIDFDENKLINFLNKYNFSLYLRPHKNDLIKYPDLLNFLKKLSKISNKIHLATHDIYPDVNEILPDFDVLISDYSALYHDFLLLNRPIIFIPYDYKNFEEQNGFLYDYFKNLPGPAVSSQDNLFNELKAIRHKTDNYARKRKALRDKIHYFQDSDSSKRVVKLVYQILNEK